MKPSDSSFRQDARLSSSVLGPSSNLLGHPSELALIKAILQLSEVLKICATRLELHPLTFYARELASAFNAFYRDCPVLGAESLALIGARLKLVAAARIALARSLDLMGMTAPEHM